MPIASPFDAGPALSDPPRGDLSTLAVASLKGYIYQLCASALARLALGPDETLYLEVAKDFRWWPVTPSMPSR